jgi:hypothetical protein
MVRKSRESFSHETLAQMPSDARWFYLPRKVPRRFSRKAAPLAEVVRHNKSPGDRLEIERLGECALAVRHRPLDPGIGQI